MTSQQINVVNFVRNNPGCCIMDVVNHEWRGRGHAASYTRVHRLVRAGVLRIERSGGRGGRVALFAVA